MKITKKEFIQMLGSSKHVDNIEFMWDNYCWGEDERVDIGDVVRAWTKTVYNFAAELVEHGYDEDEIKEYA